MIQIEPIAVDRDAAAELFGLSRSSFEARVRDKTLPQPRMIGGCARWLVSELRECMQMMPVSDLLPVRRKSVGV